MVREIESKFRGYSVLWGRGRGLRREMREISFFLSFFIFLRVFYEGERWKERIVMDRDGGSGEFVSFVTTGFRFRKGFKGRGGLAEKLKRLFFETPRPKLERREQRFSTVLGKFRVRRDIMLLLERGLYRQGKVLIPSLRKIRKKVLVCGTKYKLINELK